MKKKNLDNHPLSFSGITQNSGFFIKNDTKDFKKSDHQTNLNIVVIKPRASKFKNSSRKRLENINYDKGFQCIDPISDKDIYIKRIQERLSIRDYEELSVKAELIYDKRGFFRYYCDKILRDNLVLKTFFVHSLRRSKFLKTFLFTNTILLNFLVNSLLFSDDDLSVLKPYNAFDELTGNILQYLINSITSMFITIAVNFGLSIFLRIPKQSLYFLNNAINTNLPNLMKIGYENFLDKMKYRYLVFIIISLLFGIMTLYYLTIFFSIYHVASNTIIIKGFIAIFLDLIIIDTFIPFIVATLRSLCIKFESLRFLFRLKIFIESIRLLNG